MIRGARACLAVACLALLPAAADPREDAARIAILAERAGKLHAQATAGIAADRARRALAATTRDMDAALREAGSAAPPALRDHYALLSLLWRDYRGFLARPAARDAARMQLDRDEELTYLAMKGRRAAGPLPPPRETLVRASIAAQRVARLALLRRDAATANIQPAEAQALAELRTTLVALQPASDRDASLAAEVQVAQNQLPFLEQALDVPAPRTAHALDLVARSADNILEALERATRRAAVSPSPPR